MPVKTKAAAGEAGASTTVAATLNLAIDRKPLLAALANLNAVVERKNTIPVLSHVKLVANGKVELTGTDLDLELVQDLAAARIPGQGVTTAPAHLLHDIVRLLDLTRFAISTEAPRYYLNGIYLHVCRPSDRDQLRAVATDGHRLARASAEPPAGAGDMPGVILPRKTVLALCRLLDGFALRCPHCRETWLTCTLEPTPTRQQHRNIAAAGLPHSVCDDGEPFAPEVITCNPAAGWQIIGGSTFDDLTLAPSLDASASGHWHGHITAGAIA